MGRGTPPRLVTAGLMNNIILPEPSCRGALFGSLLVVWGSSLDTPGSWYLPGSCQDFTSPAQPAEQLGRPAAVMLWATLVTIGVA